MPPEIPGVDVGEIIGRGGNAVVYAGVQRAVQRRVAVKVDARPLTQERNQRRFAREATAAGRISGHPHVVSLIDAGTTADHRPYLVMELCEGGSLADVIKRTGALPAVDALDIGIAVTGALAAAHDAAILHRDVKPGNVLIDAFGTPRLSDFGLAARAVLDDEAFSATLEALTPSYAPPEAFAGGVPTARSDVWSMGATIYALLVGGAPRRRRDGGSLSLTELVAALPAPLPAPASPGADAVMPVLWRATAYDPADRHASAAELREDLLRARAALGPATGHVGGPEVTVVMGPPTLAPPASVQLAPGMAAASAGRTSPRPARRRWLPVALAAAALVVGGAAGSVATRAGLATADDAASAQESGTEADESTDQTAVDPPSTPASDPTQDAQDESPVSAVPQDECWGGIVSISGNVSASPRSCSEPHHWESYALGELAGDAPSARSEDVAVDPQVLATCTTDALTSYLGGAVDPATLRLEVIPPSEAAFLAGERGFACVASPAEGGERTASLQG